MTIHIFKLGDHVIRMYSCGEMPDGSILLVKGSKLDEYILTGQVTIGEGDAVLIENIGEPSEKVRDAESEGE